MQKGVQLNAHGMMIVFERPVKVLKILLHLQTPLFLLFLLEKLSRRALFESQRVKGFA